jgi:hypothetical protein
MLGVFLNLNYINGDSTVIQSVNSSRNRKIKVQARTAQVDYSLRDTGTLTYVELMEIPDPSMMDVFR